MKLFILTDLEGVAGVVSFANQAYPDGREYPVAKHLLTGEVNAAVQGAVQAGAEECIVWDGHGCGGIVFEKLRSPARLIHGRPDLQSKEFRSVLQQSDAVLFIGQHAMAGTENACLCHTQNSRTVEYYKLNGRSIGELAQFAMFAGALGVPTIFLAGDDAACREAEQLIPRITTTAVKQSLALECALSLPHAEACRQIREGVIRALQNHQLSPLAPLLWDGPFELEKRFTAPEVAEYQARREGYERIDKFTVRLRSENLIEILYA